MLLDRRAEPIENSKLEKKADAIRKKNNMTQTAVIQFAFGKKTKINGRREDEQTIGETYA